MTTNTENSEEASNIAESVTDLVLHQASTLPVPKEIRKSLWKALGALITGLVDVPAAWLDGKAQAMRDETAARSRLVHAVGNASIGHFTADQELVERATRYLGARLIREQQNREAVAHNAVQAIACDPPTADATSCIDTDWLDMFARVAETKTNVEMQSYLGKLLAGEIRKPGTFSPSTVETLAKLTPSTARLFQSLCGIATQFGDEDIAYVIVAPYGSPGNNSLSPLGFSYATLLELQDAGLLHADMGSGLNLVDGDWPETLLTLARAKFMIKGQAKEPSKVRAIDVLIPTRAGQEILTIVHATPNREYVHRLGQWLSKEIGVELAEREIK